MSHAPKLNLDKDLNLQCEADLASEVRRLNAALSEATSLAERYLKEREQAKLMADRLMETARNAGRREMAEYAEGIAKALRKCVAVLDAADIGDDEQAEALAALAKNQREVGSEVVSLAEGHEPGSGDSIPQTAMNSGTGLACTVDRGSGAPPSLHFGCWTRAEVVELREKLTTCHVSALLAGERVKATDAAEDRQFIYRTCIEAHQFLDELLAPSECSHSQGEKGAEG